MPWSWSNSLSLSLSLLFFDYINIASVRFFFGKCKNGILFQWLMNFGNLFCNIFHNFWFYRDLYMIKVVSYRWTWNISHVTMNHIINYEIYLKNIVKNIVFLTLLNRISSFSIINNTILLSIHIFDSCVLLFAVR